MSGSDQHILEFLWNAGSEIYANPRTIAANIDYEPQTVRSRVSKLRDVGLLEYHDESSGIYRLSRLAKRYIQDELDASEIESLEERYDRAGSSN